MNKDDYTRWRPHLSELFQLREVLLPHLGASPMPKSINIETIQLLIDNQATRHIFSPIFLRKMTILKKGRRSDGEWLRVVHEFAEDPNKHKFLLDSNIRIHSNKIEVVNQALLEHFFVQLERSMVMDKLTSSHVRSYLDNAKLLSADYIWDCGACGEEIMVVKNDDDVEQIIKQEKKSIKPHGVDGCYVKNYLYIEDGKIVTGTLPLASYVPFMLHYS